MSFLSQCEDLVASYAQPMLAAEGGDFKRLYTRYFGAITDLQALIETFKSASPAAFLSIPQVQFTTSGSSEGAQRCRIDGTVTYYLAFATTTKADTDRAFEVHYDAYDSVLKEFGGRYVMDADQPTNWRGSHVVLENWNAYFVPNELAVSMFTFRIKFYGFGGPPT